MINDTSTDLHFYSWLNLSTAPLKTNCSLFSVPTVDRWPRNVLQRLSHGLVVNGRLLLSVNRIEFNDIFVILTTLNNFLLDRGAEDKVLNEGSPLGL